MKKKILVREGEDKKARVFAYGRPFQPNLMFRLGHLP
jgi:hypothetical protein